MATLASGKPARVAEKGNKMSNRGESDMRDITSMTTISARPYKSEFQYQIRDWYKSGGIIILSNAPVEERKVYSWGKGTGVVWCALEELEEIGKLASNLIKYVTYHSWHTKYFGRENVYTTQSCVAFERADNHKFPNGNTRFIEGDAKNNFGGYGKDLARLQDPANEQAYRKEGEEHVLFLRAKAYKGIKSFGGGGSELEQRVPAHHEPEIELMRTRDFNLIVQYLWAYFNFYVGWGFSTGGNGLL